MTTIDSVNQYLYVCSWIPLTMVKSLLLNSASAYARSVINKFLNSFTVFRFRLQVLRIPLIFADSTYILRNPLTVVESRTTSYICLLRIRNKFKVPRKFTLQVYVRGIHLQFGTCLNTCLWNPFRHKIKRLSSAQFGLLMVYTASINKKN